MKKALFIEGNRNGYAPDQCSTTFTIRELIEYLTELEDECGGDTPVFLRNDRGYTFGSIYQNDFNKGVYDPHSGHTQLLEDWEEYDDYQDDEDDEDDEEEEY